MTRGETIRATGLNPASVSHCLQSLLESGTILEVAKLPSNGGRRAHVLRLNAEAAYFVAMGLDSTRIRCALTNLVGDVCFRWDEGIELGETLDVDRVVNSVRMVLRNLEPYQVDQVIAVGISHPGIRDREGRITAVNFGWRKVPLLRELQKAIELPIFLEDARRTCLLAEGWLDCAQNRRNWVFVIVGQGIGPDFHFGLDSANHRTAFDAFIDEGLNALKALRRSTPHE